MLRFLKRWIQGDLRFWWTFESSLRRRLAVKKARFYGGEFDGVTPYMAGRFDELDKRIKRLEERPLDFRSRRDNI